MNPPLITLTTDFGLQDSYVAQMKGVLLSSCPNASIVDVSHEVPAWDIRAGARLLSEVASLYPLGTIHIAVVDPGVGTQRRRIILETDVRTARGTRQAHFVGPDNGLFSLVAPLSARKHAWEITALQLLPQFSNYRTFDGRNVFAPVAGLLAAGRKPADFGAEITCDSLVELPPLAKPKVKDNELIGEVSHIDRFGNIISTISKSDVPFPRFSVSVEGVSQPLRQVDWYEELKPGEIGALFNSDDALEICSYRGSANASLKLRDGAIVKVIST